jgi:NADP-dependent 3-hydroxy acid dehydrogenase YdfG
MATRASNNAHALAVYLISRPPHVNLSTLDIVPTRQT